MRAAAFHQIKFLGLTPGRQRWFDRLQKLVTRMHQAKEGRPGQKRVGLRQRESLIVNDPTKRRLVAATPLTLLSDSEVEMASGPG